MTAPVSLLRRRCVVGFFALLLALLALPPVAGASGGISAAHSPAAMVGSILHSKPPMPQPSDGGTQASLSRAWIGAESWRPVGSSGWAAGLPREVEAGGTVVLVRISEGRLYLFQEGRLVARYLVSTGSSSSPTPVGRWRISDERLVNPGPGTQFGSRWMRLLRYNPATGRYRRTTYGIHGTDRPELVGQPVSNGCIRLSNPDVEALFTAAPEGTLVYTLE